MEDVIRAVVAALDSEIQGPVNIGSGVEISLLALIERMAEAGRNLEIGGQVRDGSSCRVFEPARPGEVMRISIDPERAGRKLAWSASTNLDDGLRHTLEALFRHPIGHG